MFKALRLGLMPIIFLAASFEEISAWDNDYDMPLRMECTTGEAFHRIVSKHSNRREDRRWQFQCRKQALLMDGQECFWKKGVNMYNAILDFTCPAGSMVTGVGSVHRNKREDRVWDYRCCKPDAKRACNMTSMSLSKYINEYDGYMDWRTPDVITGFYSIFNGRAGDRTWKVRTARMECGSGCSCADPFSEDWEIIDVTYDLGQFDLSKTEDVTLSTRIINNPSTTATASSEFSVSETMTDTSSYSHSVGVSITVGVGFMAGIPQLVEYSASLEVSTSYSFTWGTEESISREVTSSTTIEVPPMGRVRAKAVMAKSTIKDVPYMIFRRHKTRDCECVSRGNWTGVQHHSLHLSVEDINEDGARSAGTNLGVNWRSIALQSLLGLISAVMHLCD